MLQHDALRRKRPHHRRTRQPAPAARLWERFDELALSQISLRSHLVRPTLHSSLLSLSLSLAQQTN